MPRVVADSEIPITARTAAQVTNHDDACRMQISCRPEVVVWDHGKKNMDNVMLI